MDALSILDIIELQKDMYKIPLYMIGPSYFPDHEWRFGDEIRAFYISIDGTNASMTDFMSDTESDSGDDTNAAYDD